MNKCHGRGRLRRSACHFLSLILISAATSAHARGTFVPTGAMSVARSQHTATLLADGRVLVAGGLSGTEGSLSSAEIYDPASGAFTPTGSMNEARRMQSAVLLPDGRVLIVGGCASATAELYDPAAGTFSFTGSLLEPICGGSAVLLGNGKVLVAGAMSAGCCNAAQPELYDPATGNFSAAGNYGEPGSMYPGSGGPLWGVAVLLRDGRVLTTGDTPASLYDPASASFSLTGPSSVYPYGMYWQTTTALPDGSALVAGGQDDITCGGLSQAEVFDPASSTFTSVEPMTTSRDIHTATLLPDGTVLLTGGGDGWCFTSTQTTTEIFDPVSRSFTAGPVMSISRSEHAATALKDGTVLITGGAQYWPYSQTNTAEIYVPTN